MARSGQFQKGNPGKPKGAISKKTKAWDELGEFFTKEGAQRAAKIMRDADDKKFMVYYERLLEYFQPKLNRTDLTTGGEKFNDLPVNITINRVSAE